VHHQGFIRYRGEVIFVSESLGGWDVGLRPRKDLNYDLYFARLLLGRLEPETAAFIPITKLAQSANEQNEPKSNLSPKNAENTPIQTPCRKIKTR
jgi:hypothetical protein